MTGTIVVLGLHPTREQQILLARRMLESHWRSLQSDLAEWREIESTITAKIHSMPRCRERPDAAAKAPGKLTSILSETGTAFERAVLQTWERYVAEAAQRFGESAVQAALRTFE